MSRFDPKSIDKFFYIDKGGYMNWLREPIVVVLLTYMGTKFFDFLISIWNEKREFLKFKKEKIYNEIEELKNELGKLVELAAIWKGYDQKEKAYINNLDKDHELIGRFNKYTSIANYARDTVHWCKIVASCEKECTNDLIENKEELAKKYRLFLQKCNDYINSLA